MSLKKLSLLLFSTLSNPLALFVFRHTSTLLLFFPLQWGVGGSTFLCKVERLARVSLNMSSAVLFFRGTSYFFSYATHSGHLSGASSGA